MSEATLSLYAYKMDKVENFKGYPIKNDMKSVYPFSGDWDSETITFSNSPNMSTNELSSCSNTVLNEWDDFDVTSEIQSTLSNDKENVGLRVTMSSMETNVEKGIVYYSSEATDVTLRPKLEVVFKLPVDVIENAEKKYNPLQFRSTNQGFHISSVNNQLEKVIVYNLQGKRVAQFAASNFNKEIFCNIKLNSLHVLQIVTKSGVINKRVFNY